MKIKQIIIAGTLLVSVTTFAQKDELKALKKIYAKEQIKGDDLNEYKGLVNKLEPIATEESDKIYTNFYKCMIPVIESMNVDQTMTPIQIQTQLAKFVNPKAVSDLAAGLNATLDYEKKTGKKIYTDDIKETITSFKPMLWQAVVAMDGMKGIEDKQKYKMIADILYPIYQLDKADKEKLYLAANYSLNAQDYDTALVQLKELKAMNYTGEGTNYLAKNKASGADESFATKADRDKMVTLGTHILPKEEKLPSKKGEIVKNIALILVQQGKTDEAKAALTEARKENPDDVNLILSEADIYYKLNDISTYKKLINEALSKNPNDADLIFNLGVVSAAVNQFDDAEKYYKKVIELKPDYYNAYLNLADLKLKPDAKIVKEINSLGTTEKELKKYEVLKADRQKLFNSALPLLEKAYQLKPDDETVKSNLLTVYKFLEMNDKAKELKSKM